MSQRLAPKVPRVEFSASVRKAALARANGHCEGCGAPLVRGRYIFDHTLPLRLGGASTLANCKVLCRTGKQSCDWIKTHAEDIPGIAAIKRYGKNRLPLDIERPEKPPPRMRSRSTFPKQSRPLPKRPFPKRQRR